MLTSVAPGVKIDDRGEGGRERGRGREEGGRRREEREHSERMHATMPAYLRFVEIILLAVQLQLNGVRKHRF
jgi:hypothetical protein